MTPRPSISIIMPVYNAERTLRGSVDSVRAQSYISWELILIDDGSTDASYDIAKQLAAADERIRVYRQKNSGPSQARNRAVGLSQGELIAFLDADDRWSPHRLLDMTYAFYCSPDIGVLFSRVQFVDAKSGAKGTKTPHFRLLDVETLLAENPVCTTSNIICRRTVFEQIGGFKAGLNYAEDQDWLLRVALHGAFRICGVNTISLYYASSPDSLSSDLERMRAGWHRMISDALAHYPNTVGPLRRGASARFHRYLARRALRMRAPKLALKYMRHSLLQDPSLILRQPRRTGLTLLGTLASLTKIKSLEELVAK